VTGAFVGKKNYAASGTDTDWYRGRELSDAKREEFRRTSRQSREARLESIATGERHHDINEPNLDPNSLMPRRRRRDLTALSLFSGGGGLDLGFDRAGFKHAASYELLDFAGRTIKKNRPRWSVFAGEQEGDVTEVTWKEHEQRIDVVHGGPPCQPFSVAGRQRGKGDVRDMFPELVRAVLALKPEAFVAENVPGLKAKKFENYIRTVVTGPLTRTYRIHRFELRAADFGVPQVRTRLFFVGFKDAAAHDRYLPPRPTHSWDHLDRRRARAQIQLFPESEASSLEKCMGVREALGLPDIGVDGLAPTIRSTLTGPRHTTSILSSSNAQEVWRSLEIWPNGVALSRDAASVYPTKPGHFRLAVADCAVIQGFPSRWRFEGPVYKALGQIGNSVAPPMAYHVALSVAAALRPRASSTSSRRRSA
jgi:DNA (cytosine-5)-methyltransferase 1